MQTGVAIIGLGIMGTRMLDSLTLSETFRPVVAWDPSDAARSAAAASFPELMISVDAAAAIASPGVDVVYIASPPAAHVEYAVMAADAGKAIYCEKPLAVDLAEAEQLVDLVVSREVVNAVNFPFGAAPSVDFIAAQHASGALGDVVGVDLRLHFVPWPRVWQKEAAWPQQTGRRWIFARGWLAFRLPHREAVGASGVGRLVVHVSRRRQVVRDVCHGTTRLLGCTSVVDRHLCRCRARHRRVRDLGFEAIDQARQLVGRIDDVRRRLGSAGDLCV